MLFAFARSPHRLLGYLLGKLAFLAIILLPIGVYSWLDGWTGLKRVKGRAISVGVIVGVNLLLNLAVAVNMLF